MKQRANKKDKIKQRVSKKSNENKESNIKPGVNKMLKILSVYIVYI